MLFLNQTPPFLLNRLLREKKRNRKFERKLVEGNMNLLTLKGMFPSWMDHTFPIVLLLFLMSYCNAPQKICIFLQEKVSKSLLGTCRARVCCRDYKRVQWGRWENRQKYFMSTIRKERIATMKSLLQDCLASWVGRNRCCRRWRDLRSIGLGSRRNRFISSIWGNNQEAMWRRGKVVGRIFS